MKAIFFEYAVFVVITKDILVKTEDFSAIFGQRILDILRDHGCSDSCLDDISICSCNDNVVRIILGDTPLLIGMFESSSRVMEVSDSRLQMSLGATLIPDTIDPHPKLLAMSIRFL